MGRNVLLIGLLLVASIAAISILGQGTDPTTVPGPGLDRDLISAGNGHKSTILSIGEELGDQANRNPDLDVPDALNEGATGSYHIVIVSAASEEPISGIHAYRGDVVVAGPTGSDGVLIFTPPSGRRTTFWASGWSPSEFRPGQVPTDRVILHRADATLEVLLDNLVPDEGILQTRLEPMDWTATGKAAWAPPLEVTSPGRAVGSALAPGRYQVYIWVGPFQAQGAALSPVEIRLEPGENEVIRFDASDKSDDETDS